MIAEISAETILLNYFVSRPIGETVEVYKLFDLAQEVARSTRGAALNTTDLDSFYYYVQKDSMYFEAHIKEYTGRGFTIRKIGDKLMPFNTCRHNKRVEPFIISDLEKVLKKHHMPLAQEVYKTQQEQEKKAEKEFQSASPVLFIKHPDFIIEKKGNAFIAKTGKGKVIAEGFKNFELMPDKLLVIHDYKQTLFGANGKPLPNAEDAKHISVNRTNPQVYTVVENSLRAEPIRYIQKQNQR